MKAAGVCLSFSFFFIPFRNIHRVHDATSSFNKTGREIELKTAVCLCFFPFFLFLFFLFLYSIYIDRAPDATSGSYKQDEKSSENWGMSAFCLSRFHLYR